jgi:hypothetical protein
MFRAKVAEPNILYSSALFTDEFKVGLLLLGLYDPVPDGWVGGILKIVS